LLTDQLEIERKRVAVLKDARKEAVLTISEFKQQVCLNPSHFKLFHILPHHIKYMFRF